jgi:hypothetical protein
MTSWRRSLALAGLLAASAALLLALAGRLPLFDDEANMVLCSAGLIDEALAGPVPENYLEHPPMTEWLFGSWTALAGLGNLGLLRLPSILLWFSALAGLAWALAPWTTGEQRLGMVAAAAFWPYHLLFPLAVGWYSLQALLAVAGLGALGRLALAAARPAPWAVLWAACSGLLAWTTYAWPALLLGQLLAVTILAGPAWLRVSRFPLLAALAAILLAGLPALPEAADTAAGAWRNASLSMHRRSVGAALAFLAGESAPAVLPLAAACAAATAAGAVLCCLRGGRPALALLAMGVLPLLALLPPGALNDKRVILGSPALAAGLGLAMAGVLTRPGDARNGPPSRFRSAKRLVQIAGCAQKAARLGPLLILAGFLPAWLGLSGLWDGPWLFPRWREPLARMVESFREAPEPRLLVTANPALALEAFRAGAGSLGRPPGNGLLLVLPEERELRLRVGAWAQAVGAEAGTGGRSASVTLAIPSGPARVRARLSALQSDLAERGWQVVSDSRFGEDPLVERRHGRPGGSAAAGAHRYRLVTLVRAPAH